VQRSSALLLPWSKGEREEGEQVAYLVLGCRDQQRGHAGGTGFAIAAGSEGASSPAQAAAAALSIGSPLPVDRGRGRWRRGGGGCGGSAGGGGSAGSSSRGICSSLKTLSWYCLNCNRHRPWGGGGRDYFSRACVRSKGVGGKVEALTVFSSCACVLKAEGHYSSEKKAEGHDGLFAWEGVRDLMEWAHGSNRRPNKQADFILRPNTQIGEKRGQIRQRFSRAK